METVEPADDPIIICDKKSIDNKKKKRQRTLGKLKKCGFDAEDLSRQFALKMDRAGFEEIAQKQLGLVTVSSTNPDFVELPLMTSFRDELKLERRIWDALEHHDFLEPLPVQQVTIPYIQKFNSDFIVKAQTGSGKTMAFMLPIIDYIVKVKSALSNKAPNQDSPYAVIVAPTRELTLQIARETTRFINDYYLVKVAFGIGDMHRTYRDNTLKNGCDIVVLTAGFLYHYFKSNETHSLPRLKTNNIRFVVLDEADKLLERERRSKNDKSNLPSSREIVFDFVVNNLTNDKKKTDFNVLLFSATLDNDLMYSLVMPKNYIRIDVGQEEVVSSITQEFLDIRGEHEKLENLMVLIDYIASHYNEDFNKESSSERIKERKGISRTIIFVNCIRRTERITLSLRGQHYHVGAINSGCSQSERTQTLQDMERGKIDIVVATDLLSRGLNIPKVGFVINYDFPKELSAQEYIHRVGRCGRIGNSGRSYSFIDPSVDFRAAPALIQGCTAAGQEVPQVLLEAQHYYERHMRSSSSGSFGRFGQNNNRQINHWNSPRNYNGNNYY